MDNDALKISNVYAEYATSNSKTGSNVSTLSKMLAGKETESTSINEIDTDKPMYMDKVIISKESLAVLDAKK